MIRPSFHKPRPQVLLFPRPRPYQADAADDGIESRPEKVTRDPPAWRRRRCGQAGAAARG